MEKEGLVTHEGYMDATSGVLINIRTTEKGRQKYFNEIVSIEIPDEIDGAFRDFLKEMLT